MAAINAEIGSDVKLKNFLTSDLGAPTPLHISLSRPLSLSTADKDEFLDRVTTAIQASTVSSFNVTPKSLAWYKSPDSDRLFLIIRVATAGHTSSTNPELVTLLNRCNGVASLFGQPQLYANRNVDGQQVGAAFHVSIAWTFDIPGEAASLRSLSVFRQADFKAVSEWRIEVRAVKVKIGNMVHHIPLGAGSRVGRGATWSRKVEGEGDGEFKG
jgi:U6 snRNA phosphodiesterase